MPVIWAAQSNRSWSFQTIIYQFIALNRGQSLELDQDDKLDKALNQTRVGMAEALSSFLTQAMKF